MSEKLAPLTSLRFVAAMMILFHHGHAEFKTIGTAVAGLPLSGGVSFFFVLSGFILAYSNPRIPSFSAALEFWGKRFARIWPIHIATILLLLVMNAKISGGTFETAGAITANVLLLQSWFSDFRYIFSLNAVSWSISAEAFFYLLFPALIYRIDQTWAVKLALCSVLVVLSCLFYQDQATAGTLPESVFPTWMLIQFSPPARLLEFMAGIVAFVLWRKHLQNLAISRAGWTVIEAIVIAIAVTAWMQSHRIPVHLLGDFARGWWFLAGVFIVPATLIILLMATSKGIISTVLNKRPLVFLGEISFSLYMVHQLVLRFYQNSRSLFNGYPNDAVMIWYIGTSILAAAILWLAVEEPCRRVIVARFRRVGQTNARTIAPATS